MRIVLDECLPRRLGRLLPAHQVTTVQELGASGMRNGALLHWLADKCDLFVTIDRGMRYQQTLPGRTFAVALLQAPSNRLPDLAPLVPSLEAALATLQAGQMLVVGERPAGQPRGEEKH